MRAWAGDPGGARYWALYRLVLELEGLRLRVPEAIMEGEVEEALLDASNLLSSMVPRQLIPRPYSGLDQEARLLSQLATALRLRMIRAGTPYVSGVEYFIERLDSFLASARAALGRHPDLPLSQYGDTIGIS